MLAHCGCFCYRHDNVLLTDEIGEPFGDRCVIPFVASFCSMSSFFNVEKFSEPLHDLSGAFRSHVTTSYSIIACVLVCEIDHTRTRKTHFCLFSWASDCERKESFTLSTLCQSQFSHDTLFFKKTHLRGVTFAFHRRGVCELSSYGPAKEDLTVHGDFGYGGIPGSVLIAKRQLQTSPSIFTSSVPSVDFTSHDSTL